MDTLRICRYPLRCFSRRFFGILSAGLSLGLTTGWTPLAGQRVETQTAPQTLVLGFVDDADRVTLTGNVHPVVRLGKDLGPVEDEFRVERLLLLLKRPPQREAALEQFLRDAHTPGTASYHQWLTPEEFGRRFGAADSDIAALTAWLESHGFTVNKVHRGRIAVEFSGNAALVRTAFHTEIHRYAARVHGQDTAQYANALEPQIPTAFAPLVAGLSPMNSLHATPMVKVTGSAKYDTKTHEAEWTYPLVGNALTYELSPSDFAVQYDLVPVYLAGTTGTGESIGIISASNVDLSLVAAY